MLSRVMTLRATALLLLVPSSCTGSGVGACTEIGCESRATVTYNTTITGKYLLRLSAGGGVDVRCNDASIEAENNPPWITCTGNGFEILGDEAISSSVTVSITLLEGDMDELARNEVVALTTGPNGVLQPNGPDCEPTCFERSGSILLNGGN